MADVYKCTVRARVYITKNEITRYDQEYLTSDTTITESAHQRAVLATNMAAPEELTMDNLTTARVFTLEADREIVVALNTVANTFTIAANGMFMIVGTVTHVFVQNNSTTYTATVEYLATD